MYVSVIFTTNYNKHVLCITTGFYCGNSDYPENMNVRVFDELHFFVY